MGNAKPRRNNKQYWINQLSKFAFNDDTKAALMAIKRYKAPVMTDEIINDLELAVNGYLAFKESYADNVKPSEIKAAIDSFRKAAEAMSDALDIDSMSKALIRDNFILTGMTGAEQTANWHLFDALPDKLYLMIDAAKVAQQEFTVKKFPIPAREWLAHAVAHALDRHGVKSTAYNDGPFAKCFEICLRSTDDLYKEDISRLVKSVVRERKTPQA